MRIDLESAKTAIEAIHTYSLVGMDEMYPACSCGESCPCAERELGLQLIGRIHDLESVLSRASGALSWASDFVPAFDENTGNTASALDALAHELNAVRLGTEVV